MRRARYKGLSLRRRVELFLSDPVVESVILALILVSVGLLFGELVAQSDAELRAQFSSAGNVINALFVVELSARYWVARDKRRYFFRYGLDVLSVIPLIRPLRVFRVFRLFRAGYLVRRRMVARGNVVFQVLSEFISLQVLTLTLVLSASMVLYDNEVGVNPEFPDYQSVVWFSVMSLVGGEPVGATPVTSLGRWATLALMWGGLTFFGIFVAMASATLVKRFSDGMGVHELSISELRDHTIVCGWNNSGLTLLRELFGRTARSDQAVVLIVESAADEIDFPVGLLPMEHLYVLKGDYTKVEVLEEAGVHHSGAAILLADSTMPRSDQDRDARTVLAALTIERLVPGIFTVAELTNRDNETLLKMAGVEEIVVGDWYSGVILGSASRSRGLVQVLDEILTTEHGNAFYSVLLPPKYDRLTVAEVHSDMLGQYNAVLVSLERHGKVTVNPPHFERVHAGDRVVFLSKKEIVW